MDTDSRAGHCSFALIRGINFRLNQQTAQTGVRLIAILHDQKRFHSIFYTVAG